MSGLGEQQVSNAVIRHLEKRAARLVLLVETATGRNPDKEIREGGAQLVDRILEMLEEVLELHAAGDGEAVEAVEDFHKRLYLAQKRVDGWNIPESVRKKIEKKSTGKTEPAPRRRKKAA